MTTPIVTSPELQSAVARAVDRRDRHWAYPLGFWSAIITTAGGVLYFVIILGAVLTGRFTLPPSEALQIFGGIASLLFCPVLVVLVGGLHTITPASQKGSSQISFGFTLLFAAVVSINRFTQFGAVRQSLMSGVTDGIDWFLPYGDHSLMLGLEILGWGWFLGLAMLFAAPLFAEGRLQRWLRGLMALYGALGLLSALAYLLASPLAAIGFVAWGLILFIITALLAVHFQQAESLWREGNSREKTL